MGFWALFVTSWIMFMSIIWWMAGLASLSQMLCGIAIHLAVWATAVADVLEEGKEKGK